VLAACSSGPAAPDPGPSPGPGPGRGFPVAGPWASYHGAAEDIDLDRLRARFRVITLDADPGERNFSRAQLRRLRDHGRNRVLSYFNLGAVEREREYFRHVPEGFTAPADNRRARLGSYDGYPDEYWMDPADPAWRRLLLDHIAPRLVAQGVDGFYFDNLEVLERTEEEGGRACGARCRRAGFSLVRELRERYPRLLFVMQNAAGPLTRKARTGGGSFAELLDGVAQEEAFTRSVRDPKVSDSDEDATYVRRTDRGTVAELAAWRRLGLRPGGRPFWIATEDYANTCGRSGDELARSAASASRRNGFSPYVSNKSALQGEVCFRSGRLGVMKPTRKGNAA
jgi:cysteinyl-tRNA synthetase